MRYCSFPGDYFIRRILKMGELEMLKRVRENYKTRKIRMVVVTA